jgi:hypothetical protein
MTDKLNTGRMQEIAEELLYALYEKMRFRGLLPSEGWATSKIMDAFETVLNEFISLREASAEGHPASPPKDGPCVCGHAAHPNGSCGILFCDCKVYRPAPAQHSGRDWTKTADIANGETARAQGGEFYRKVSVSYDNLTDRYQSALRVLRQAREALEETQRYLPNPHFGELDAEIYRTVQSAISEISKVLGGEK